MNTAARQLFQSAPTGTTAAVVFTAKAHTEFTRIVIANTTANPATFQLFHDDDGTTLSAATALYYDVQIAANTTLNILSEAPSGGITVSKNGSLGFRTGTANALTITGYGQTAAGR